ncbi:MAG: phosphorybosylanthranilate isomerase [Candidatus Methanomethylicota archaeon]|uniref:Phosphorybosylanthranilate isomerase n=1 Tax=Thermoproteota archaeon TaxID=2056631 RepID=A0A497ELP0_9CREN|nr:MAG: phosphorybosylanthranilate isomerase [Candidatus Verstraetearchaeota archaeon]
MLAGLFDVDKAVIGVVHVKPLIGSLLYGGDFEKVVDLAVRDAVALVEGGVDGVIVENFHDYPYYPRRVPRCVVAQLAVVVREVVRSVNVPVGVSVLRNDGVSAMSIACGVGARFIRVNVWCGAMVTDQGVIEGEAYRVLRLRRFLGCDVRVFADVFVKHAFPLGLQDLKLVARDTFHRGRADALVVTGRATGLEADLGDVRLVKEACGAPVFVGSGVSAENVREYLGVADGVIVGSYFRGGDLWAPVDVERVRRLVRAVRG